jgi:hypothetical protein
MHNIKDAKVFIESLNVDQRRALAYALLIAPPDGRGLPTVKYESQVGKMAERLADAFALLRAVRAVTRWNDIEGF